MIKKLLREALAFSKILNEIDWDETFDDVKKTCINTNELVDYLNKVISNRGKDTNDREKFSAKYPFVHSKSDLLKGSKDNLNLEDFIKQITSEPSNIVNTSEKMLKSGKRNEFVYKTGIPALRGLVYDIKKSKFYFINTCPGAGSCAAICYALKGNFIRFPRAYDLLTKRLNLLLNNPERYEEMMYNDLVRLAEKHEALEGYKSKIKLRWNDSGDFFTKKYVEIANRVMSKLNKNGYNIQSYAYTKVGDVANDDVNFDTTFSQGSNKREANKVDIDKNKTAIIIPKEIGANLNLNKISDTNEFKKSVASHFNLDVNNILTYDELMDTPFNPNNSWDVIVTNKDGDDAGFRKDVNDILLKFH